MPNWQYTPTVYELAYENETMQGSCQTEYGYSIGMRLVLLGALLWHCACVTFVCLSVLFPGHYGP